MIYHSKHPRKKQYRCNVTDRADFQLKSIVRMMFILFPSILSIFLSFALCGGVLFFFHWIFIGRIIINVSLIRKTYENVVVSAYSSVFARESVHIFETTETSGGRRADLYERQTWRRRVKIIVDRTNNRLRRACAASVGLCIRHSIKSRETSDDAFLNAPPCRAHDFFEKKPRLVLTANNLYDPVNQRAARRNVARARATHTEITSRAETENCFTSCISDWSVFVVSFFFRFFVIPLTTHDRSFRIYWYRRIINPARGDRWNDKPRATETVIRLITTFTSTAHYNGAEQIGLEMIPHI